MGATSAPFRKVALGSNVVETISRPDGTILVRSREALGAYPRTLTERLVEAAARVPDRVFIAERDGTGWRRITYAEIHDQVERVAQALLDRGLSAETPVAALSPASIAHAILALACQHVGIPFAPITPAYSLLDTSFAKLRHVCGQLAPRLIFAQNGRAFARAFDAVDTNAEIVVARDPPDGRNATLLEELAVTIPGETMRRAHDALTPDSIAKILFTSGSTGFPKGVVTTHRMLCSNQQMFLQALPLLADPPPVVLSWLPWHHCSGGSQILGAVLHNAGTLYIDEGKPVPGGMEVTVANLRDVAPTVYFSAPRGLAELIPYLRAEEHLRRNFFSQLSMLYYSGAALSDTLVDALDEIAVATTGERIPMLCGYGATEVAPLALAVNWHADRSGLAGLPVPGIDLKLVPYGDKFEARVRGDSTTPGYWQQPDLTRALFDEEGFLKLGDALSFVDPQEIARGLAFDGRIAEDFKLSTGTWVNVGALRAQLAAALGPMMLDAVIVGENRDEVGALIFPDEAGCAAICGGGDTIMTGEVVDNSAFRAHVQDALDRLAAAGTGSSTFVARALLLRAPPSAAAGELTDKGSISQRAVATGRKLDMDRLFAPAASREVFRSNRERGHTLRSPRGSG